MRLWLAIWVAASASLFGCLAPSSNVCSDGRLCPVGTVCDIAHQGCASPEQIRACQERDDGAVCDFRGNSGQCDQGVCLGATCGDGRINVGEACDDGNVVDGDGCSSDCLSSEACGNGVIDTLTGETCDCGATELAAGCESLNSDEAGARCKANCTAHCGDGVLNEAEECDAAGPVGGCFAFGFDRGPLGCSSSCATVFSGCANFGFKDLSAPGIAGASITDMWVSPSGALYTAGGPHLGVLVGEVWQTFSAPTNRTFTAVHGVSDQHARAVVVIDGVTAKTSHLYGYQTGTWVNLGGIPSIGTHTRAVDLWVESDTKLTVVGRWHNDVEPPQAGGFIAEYVDGKWTISVDDVPSGLASIVATGQGDELIAVGDLGQVARRVEGKWNLSTISDGTPNLDNLYAAGPADIFATGE